MRSRDHRHSVQWRNREMHGADLQMLTPSLAVLKTLDQTIRCSSFAVRSRTAPPTCIGTVSPKVLTSFLSTICSLSEGPLLHLRPVRAMTGSHLCPHTNLKSGLNLRNSRDRRSSPLNVRLSEPSRELSSLPR